MAATHHRSPPQGLEGMGHHPQCQVAPGRTLPTLQKAPSHAANSRLRGQIIPSLFKPRETFNYQHRNEALDTNQRCHQILLCLPKRLQQLCWLRGPAAHSSQGITPPGRHQWWHKRILTQMQMRHSQALLQDDRVTDTPEQAIFPAQRAPGTNPVLEWANIAKLLEEIF